MNLRLVGFLLTTAAVVVLLGSLVAGVLGGAAEESYPVLVRSSIPRSSDRIRVEVLNGAGISGLARNVTERLRAEGFDVVYYGNAGPLTRDSTTILDRSGNAAAVEAISDAIGVERVVTAIDTTLYLEATIILAPDWPSITEP